MTSQNEQINDQQRTLSEADLMLLMRLMEDKPKKWQVWRRKGHFRGALGDMGNDFFAALKNLFVELGKEIVTYYKTRNNNDKQK